MKHVCIYIKSKKYIMEKEDGDSSSIINGQGFHSPILMNCGVIIQGRFQLLTNQHKEIIENQLNKYDQCYVFIQIIEGEKSKLNKIKNPFTYHDRKEMIDCVFEYNKEKERIIIEKFNRQYIPDIIIQLENKYQVTIDNYICGEDRQNSYISQFEFDSDKENKYYKYFKNRSVAFDIISRNRKNDLDISQTKQRELLSSNNFQKQKEIIPEELFKYLEYYSKLLKKYLKECKNVETIIEEDEDFNDIYKEISILF